MNLLDALESDQKVKDVEYMIRALKNENRVIRSDMDTDGETQFDRRLADVDGRIKKLLEIRRRMVDRHENGWEILARNNDRIKELETQLVNLRAGNRLAQLVKLAQAINSMKAEITPEKLAANLEHLEQLEED